MRVLVLLRLLEVLVVLRLFDVPVVLRLLDVLLAELRLLDEPLVVLRLLEVLLPERLLLVVVASLVRVLAVLLCERLALVVALLVRVSVLLEVLPAPVLVRVGVVAVLRVLPVERLVLVELEERVEEPVVVPSVLLRGLLLPVVPLCERLVLVVLPERAVPLLRDSVADVPPPDVVLPRTLVELRGVELAFTWLTCGCSTPGVHLAVGAGAGCCGVRI